MLDKRCEYSKYFKQCQTSFQTGVDKSFITSCLTFYTLPAPLKQLKILSVLLHLQNSTPNEKTF